MKQKILKILEWNVQFCNLVHAERINYREKKALITSKDYTVTGRPMCDSLPNFTDTIV